MSGLKGCGYEVTLEDALGTGKVLLNWGVVNNCTDSTHLLSTCYVLGAALRAGVETGMDGHSSPVRRGSPAQETGRVVTPLQVVIPAMKETNKKQRERERGPEAMGRLLRGGSM